MPSALCPRTREDGIVTKFTNCRLVLGNEIVEEDLWVSAATGKILHSQASFYEEHAVPDQVIDLGGRIISPGLIECQLNGAFGFNFSDAPENMATYSKGLQELNQKLISTGVTSYVPTITSQKPEVYQKVLPYLGPSGQTRKAENGSESLGAHVEGPFLSPTKNGIHNVDVLIQANSFGDLEDCYGSENLRPGLDGTPAPVRMITAAPERGRMGNLIPEITRRGIIYSVGHTEATYEEASAAVDAGATMITHLFNAMRPLHHRNPGVFGVLGIAENRKRPYFGIIADGIHLHPATIKIAFNSHPDGFILVTDAMHLAGLPDGAYQWTNGNTVNNIVKVGAQLILEGSDKIAGSSFMLIDCINNFLEWTGVSIATALKAVTATPAEMLSLQGVKGSLEPGADADMVIFSEETLANGNARLHVDEVWKFGRRVAAVGSGSMRGK